MAPRIIRKLSFAGLIARAMRALRMAGMKPLAELAARIRELGPYAVIWLLLPGGSLIALSMWVMRHRAWTAIQRRRILVAVAVLSGILLFPTGA